ncbi:TetR/AcrR family transcriptional regulator [Aureivirga marina]|uniref:TetR/AcrR family transcriptional regulator n=1 Tax=Aureivirga marina TaxID=1182451 RepID=UPI0018CAE48C|nr:TetR/AcrR family transcriptional regulator [Aureivirga marina]
MTKNEIINSALSLFILEGIKNTSMDEIAQKNNISKKTIYKYFSSKNDLVENVLNFAVLQIENGIFKIQKEAKNAVDEFRIYNFSIEEHFSEIIPDFFNDIDLICTDLKVHYAEKICEIIQLFLRKNIERGIEENMYFKDCNLELIVNSYVNIYRLVLIEKFNKTTETINSILFLNELLNHSINNNQDITNKNLLLPIFQK